MEMVIICIGFPTLYLDNSLKQSTLIILHSPSKVTRITSCLMCFSFYLFRRSRPVTREWCGVDISAQVVLLLSERV